MKKIKNLILIVFLIFFICIFSKFALAPEVVYPVNTTYGINVTFCSNGGFDPKNPPNQAPLPCSLNKYDYTHRWELGAFDGHTLNQFGCPVWYNYFEYNISEISVKKGITNIHFNWTGSGTWETGDPFYLYIYNYSSSKWFLLNQINATINSNVSVYGNLNDSYNLPDFFNGDILYFFITENDADTETYQSDEIYINITYNIIPTSTLISPPDNFYFSSFIKEFNCSYTDEEGLINGSLYIWNNGGSLNSTLTEKITGKLNSTNITHTFTSDGTYYWNCLVFNQGNYSEFALNNRTIIIDTTPPKISIDYPISHSNFSIDAVEINYTLTELNPDNCWWTNDSGITNHTMVCGENISETWEEGLNTIWVYTNDSVNHKNSSSITFRIDTTSPSLNLIYPIDNSEINYNTSINLNFTVFDSGIGLDSCWYNLDNSNNISLSNCQNTTFSSNEGTHNVYLYANDTLGNEATDINSFTISLDAPAITLNYPPNDTYFIDGNNTYFNFTASDGNGLSECQLWGNWSGWHKNYTWYKPNSGIMNYTTINLTEGDYFWSVWCNDTTSKGRFSGYNFTVYIDQTLPIITNVSLFTTQGSQTFSFNFSIIEKHPAQCWYTLFNSSGEVDTATIENTSISCSSTTTETASNYGTYNLTIYTNDSANNVNSSTTTFTLSPSSPSPGGGGGIVIQGIIGNWTMSTEGGADKYELEMVKGSSRTKKILFSNNDVEEKEITLSCEGELCKYLTFSSKNLTLPVGKKIFYSVLFTIELPEDIEKGKYLANIIAKDQLNMKGILTVDVDVGTFGKIIEAWIKLFSNKDIKGIKIPYILIFTISTLGFSLISYYSLYKSRISGSKFFGLFTGILGGFILLIFI